MANTTTTIGRSKLVFPDLGYDGGSTLEDLVTDMFKNLSDDLDSRFQEYSAIANSTTVELDHNFGVAFEELSISIFTGSGTNLTKVSSPLANGWALNAKAGSLKTILEITTPSSGAPHTFAVQCVVGGSGSGGLQITEIDHTFASDLETGKHYIVDLSGLTTADLSLNLPAGLAGSQIKVSVVGIEAQTNYLTTPYYLKLIPDGTEKIYYDGTQYDDILVGKVSPWIQINWDSTFGWVVEDPSNFTSRNLSGNWVIDGIIGKSGSETIASGLIGELVLNVATSSVTITKGGTESAVVASGSLSEGIYLVKCEVPVNFTAKPSNANAVAATSALLKLNSVLLTSGTICCFTGNANDYNSMGTCTLMTYCKVPTGATHTLSVEFNIGDSLNIVTGTAPACTGAAASSRDTGKLQAIRII